MNLEQATTDRVFEAARTATFRRTNLGLIADVWVGAYSYRVEAGGSYLASIDCREGYGGTEYVYASATPEQDRALRRSIADQAAK